MTGRSPVKKDKRGVETYPNTINSNVSQLKTLIHHQNMHIPHTPSTTPAKHTYIKTTTKV